MLTSSQAEAVIRRYERKAKAFDRKIAFDELDDGREKAVKRYRNEWLHRAKRLQRDLDDDYE